MLVTLLQFLLAGAACKHSLQSRNGSPSAEGWSPWAMVYLWFMVFYKICFQVSGVSGTQVIGGSFWVTHLSVCRAISILDSQPSLWFPKFSISVSLDNSIHQTKVVSWKQWLQKHTQCVILLLCWGPTLQKCLEAIALSKHTKSIWTTWLIPKITLCSCVWLENLF